MVIVAGVGPTRFGDEYPNIRIPEAFHGENHRVHHLIEEIRIRQTRTRIRIGDVLRLEEGVIEFDIDGIERPGEIRVHVEEEERFGPVQELQHRFHDPIGNVRPEGPIGGRKRRLEDVHGGGGPDFDFTDAVGLEGALDSAHRRDETEPGFVAGGGGGEDLVSDEEVTDFGLGVIGEDTGPNPVVG